MGCLGQWKKQGVGLFCGKKGWKSSRPANGGTCLHGRWVVGSGASGSELAIVPFGVDLESPLAELMAL